MVLREVELPDFHGRPEKVFLVVLGITIFVSLSHLANALGVDIAKASMHHQLQMVGTPQHLCSAHTLQEAKQAGMVPKNSRAFRLIPLPYMLKVVDAFPATWAFLKAPLQLLAATACASPTSSGMPAIPVPQLREATLTVSHINNTSQVLPLHPLLTLPVTASAASCCQSVRSPATGCPMQGVPRPSIHLQPTIIKHKYSEQQLHGNYGLKEQKPSYRPNLQAFKAWATLPFHASRVVYQALRPTSMVQEEAHINMYLGFNHLFRGVLHKPTLLVRAAVMLDSFTCDSVSVMFDSTAACCRMPTQTPSTTLPSLTSLCRGAHSPTTSRPTSRLPGARTLLLVFVSMLQSLSSW
jgi:hypothetical protein